jgi:hypothetical protein
LTYFFVAQAPDPATANARTVIPNNDFRMVSS